MGWRLIFENYTPFPQTAVKAMDYAQSADVMLFAHIDYEPQKLTRLDHTEWEWEALDFAPTIEPPTGVDATPDQPNSTDAIATEYTYYVTATDTNGNESRASDPIVATNDLSLAGNYNVIEWDAVADAVSYTIYKGDNSLPGYIGTSEDLSFKDRNLIAISSDTPPRATNPFGVGNYPSTVTLGQQRAWFARTRLKPNGIWATQSANFENMDMSRPARATDAISFALVSQQVNSVNQMAFNKQGLLALTSNSIFTVRGESPGAAITPSAIVPDLESGRGSSRLQPLSVDHVQFYYPAKAGEVRTIGYDYQVEGVRTNNVAIFSSHLFKGRQIVSWDYQDNPFSCIWAVLDNGTMLCFTWEEEQEVWGWTRMEIDGFVEDCGVITEDGYDRLYILVRRTIGGVERRFHERLALPHVVSVASACHLDCSVTQATDDPTGVVTGIHHLEGETVSAYADGYSFHDLVVEQGSITLPNGHESTLISVGLLYEGRIATLPPVVAAQGGTLHVDPQNIGDVTVRAIDSKGLEISADGTNWESLAERTGGQISEDQRFEACDFETNITGNWQNGASLQLRQREPIPAHITALFYELVVSAQ